LACPSRHINVLRIQISIFSEIVLDVAANSNAKICRILVYRIWGREVKMKTTPPDC